MKKSEIQIGQSYTYKGSLVTVIEPEGDGFVVESPEQGEEFAKARDLQPLDGGSAPSWGHHDGPMFGY